MNSRSKGAAGEREAAKAITRVLGITCRRGVQYAGGPDSPDIIGIPGVHVEVKRVQALNLTAAMSQSIRDAGAARIPVVMHRRNREAWLLTIRLADLRNFMAVMPNKPGKETESCSLEQASAPRD